MLKRLSATERTLILLALVLATLVVLVIFISLMGKYIDTLKPTPTLRSLPPILTATSAPSPTLRPSQTPPPGPTAEALPSPTP
jgi:hypothetical protein